MNGSMTDLILSAFQNQGSKESGWGFFSFLGITSFKVPFLSQLHLRLQRLIEFSIGSSAFRRDTRRFSDLFEHHRQRPYIGLIGLILPLR
jgi:hypothetical protein